MAIPVFTHDLHNIVFSGMVGDKFLTELYQCLGRFTFNTEGGDTSAMLAALDFLERTPLTLVATGACMSAGIPILAAGEHRIATKRCRFMVHRPKAFGFQEHTADDSVQEATELKLLEQQYVDALASRTRRDAKFWKAKVQEDWWFSAQEALKVGLVDEIL